MSIKNRVFSVLIIILLLTGGGIGFAITKLILQGPELEATEGNIKLVSNSAVPLLVTIKELKADVIQVQGWLTDISATRGLPGFDDGFSVAKEFAEKFEADALLARGYAKSLDMPEVLKALTELETAFPPFYAGGQKMAQAYIDKGPEGGNPQMEEFDTVAATMGDATDNLVKLVEEKTSEKLNALQALSERVRKSNAGLVSFLLFMSLVAAIAMVFGAFFIYRIIFMSFRDLNLDVNTVMAENDNHDLHLDPDRQDEFGPVAAALYAFQANKKKSNKIAAEQRKTQEAQAQRTTQLEEIAVQFDNAVRG